jgi:apolipoprotein N-acyltransferase
VLSGVLTVLAFPPVGWWPLAIFIPLPLIWAGVQFSREQGGRRIWPRALLAGLAIAPFWLWLHRFFADIAAPAWPLHALYMGLYASLFVWLLARVGRTMGTRWLWLVAPVMWTGIEFLRGEIVIGGYPWFLAAHPLIENPAARWLAKFAGIYAVGTLAAFVVTYLSRLGRDTSASAWWTIPGRVRLHEPWGTIVAFAMTLAITFVPSQISRVPGPHPLASIRLSALQTNLPQSNKIGWQPGQQERDFAEWRLLTQQAASKSPDLIAWPETMFPGFALDRDSIAEQRRFVRANGNSEAESASTYFARTLLEDQATHQVPLLIGSIAFDQLKLSTDAAGKAKVDHAGKFNSAVLLRFGKIEEQRYDKMHLTPFGEQIPGLWRWPALQNKVVGLGAAGMAFDLSQGTVPRLFSISAKQKDGHTESVRFVAPICYETTFSDTTRELVYQLGERKADIMINLSNDGWFGNQPGLRETHLLVNRWRCVELGVPMFRAVNTGISAAIDREGNVVAQGVDGRSELWNVPGVLTAELTLPPAGSGTLFGRIGNIWGWAMFGLTTLLMLVTFFKRPAPTNA